MSGHIVRASGRLAVRGDEAPAACGISAFTAFRCAIMALMFPNSTKW